MNGDPRRFFEELERRAREIYRANPELPNHLDKHGWVTGCLGDPFAPVWFLAENPSLTQVEKVREAQPTRDLQWTMSRGDALFRQCLFDHGFKGGESPLSPGDWRCYITDVIKSTERVKEHSAQSKESLLASARAWARVLSWELKQGRPKIIVSVGDAAREALNDSIAAGKIPDPGKWGAWRMHVPHYVYITARPDNKRQLAANHPVRVEEYRKRFAAIARARDALPRTLRASDGSEYFLGSPEEVDQARAEVREILRYGSNMGQFSQLSGESFGPPSWQIVDAQSARRLFEEAEELLCAGVDLPEAAKRLLGRLARENAG